MNVSTSPDSTPDLSTPAGRRALILEFVSAMASAMASAMPDVPELVEHPELVFEPEAGQ
jgi:hypothetical protein